MRQFMQHIGRQESPSHLPATAARTWSFQCLLLPLFAPSPIKLLRYRHENPFGESFYSKVRTGVFSRLPQPCSESYMAQLFKKNEVLSSACPPIGTHAPASDRTPHFTMSFQIHIIMTNIRDRHPVGVDMPHHNAKITRFTVHSKKC